MDLYTLDTVQISAKMGHFGNHKIWNVQVRISHSPKPLLLNSDFHIAQSVSYKARKFPGSNLKLNGSA